jgi:hypothetical protein
MALYLDLYHGRKDPNEDMDGWGFDGPLIGPLEHVHITYMDTFRIFFKAFKVARACGFEDIEDIWMENKGDLIKFQGNYYGDWSISDMTAAKAAEMRKENNRINAISYTKYLKLMAADNPE